jgi:hypothetical protein
VRLQVIAPAAAALSLLASGCGGSDSHDQSAAKPAGSCSTVSRRLVDVISEDMLLDGTMRAARQVRSRRYRNVWFVSARIVRTPQDPGVVATWATNRPAGGAAIYSVDTNALQNTGWASATEANVPLTLGMADAQASRRCVSSAG